MEWIGPRVSYVEKDNELSIVISSLSEKKKNRLMLFWIIAWVIGGLCMFAYYFMATDNQVKLMIIVWLAFWFYFLFKVLRAYRWRVMGKEIIKIREGKIFYKLDIAGTGKIKGYELDLINDLRILTKEDKSADFFKSMENSYWIISGERIGFNYGGKLISFGLQLTDNEASSLLKILRKRLAI